MANSTEDQTQDESPRDITEVMDVGHDAMLAIIVGLAHTQGDDFALGVTLNAEGAVISGKLVGVNTWLQQVDESYGDRLVGLTQALREGFTLPESNALEEDHE